MLTAQDAKSLDLLKQACLERPVLPAELAAQWLQSDASIELLGCGFLWPYPTSLAKVLHHLRGHQIGSQADTTYLQRANLDDTPYFQHVCCWVFLGLQTQTQAVQKNLTDLATRAVSSNLRETVLSLLMQQQM